MECELGWAYCHCRVYHPRHIGKEKAHLVQKRDNAKILIDLGAENICQQIVRKHFGNEPRLSLGRLLGAYFAVVRLHTPAALVNVALIIYMKSDRVAGVHARLVVGRWLG